MIECIVCKSKKIELFQIIKDKTYWRCLHCYVTFLDKKNYVDLETEKKHYLKHNNLIEDIGYRKFLSRLITPIKKYISLNDLGLDYGCGYCPTLFHMLKEDGYKIEFYDPFFFPNQTIFFNKYNFITCAEVVEHFFNPHEEFNKIDNILEKNGWLGLMTSFMTEDYLFKDWYYRRDPTHVVFYKKKTFEVIASQRNWNLIFPCNNIVLFNKNYMNLK